MLRKTKKFIFNRRIELLHHWIAGNRVVNVEFAEMFAIIFNPFTCDIRASKYITAEEAIANYYKISFKNITNPLYFPQSIPLHQLYQCTCEIFNKDDWHNYEFFNETNVTPTDIVVDCGAAEGLFALNIHERARKIYAIEPLQIFIESMEKTFKNIDNIEIIPVALGNKKSEMFLKANGISSSLTTDICSNAQKVKVVTLDSLFFEKNLPITYIKMDLEGFEMNALEGGIKTIKKYLPKLAITTYHKKNHYELIGNFLRDINNNYKISLRGVEERCGSPVMLYAWI